MYVWTCSYVYMVICLSISMRLSICGDININIKLCYIFAIIEMCVIREAESVLF